jgi:hypothetical protein
MQERRRARAERPIRAVDLGSEELVDSSDRSSVDERIALPRTVGAGGP